MRRFARSLIIALLGSVLAGAAFAQDPRQNEPGKFDFYLLALSWSVRLMNQTPANTNPMPSTLSASTLSPR